MPSFLMRIFLFLSSYFPLALIFFVQLIPDQPWMALVILGIGFFGLIGMLFFFWWARRMAPVTVTVTSISRKGAEVMSYIFSYLIPFIAMSWDKPKDALSLGIIFAVLGLIYVNSNMIHVNPMLYVFGFKLYEIENGRGEIFSLLTRNRIWRQKNLSVVKVGEDILLDKGEKQ